MPITMAADKILKFFFSFQRQWSQIFQMNHLPNRQFTWNVKPDFLWKKKIKKIVLLRNFYRRVQVLYFLQQKMWDSTIKYHIDPEYWDTLSTYHTWPKIWESILLPVDVSKILLYACKQCRPWSDTAFCSVWPGSTLFAKAYLSQNLGLLW